MSAPLPRVYELGEGGKAVAVPPPPGTAGIIGADFKGDDLTRSSKETVFKDQFLASRHSKYAIYGRPLLALFQAKFYSYLKGSEQGSLTLATLPCPEQEVGL